MRARSSRMSLRMRGYILLFRFIFSVFGRFLVGNDRWLETQKGKKRIRAFAESLDESASERRPILWFHAASVGELESLWSVIELAHADGRFDFVLTVFSTSAWKHLHRMARMLEGRAPLFVGYSPLEGDWEETIRAFRPSFFVTAKYEAWPEMWNALAKGSIPLAIIGAKPRSSLLWAKRILRCLAGSIPRILFFSFDLQNEKGLQDAFPASEIRHGSDPRWDRVFKRAEKKHFRVSELRESMPDLPRPWGVVGSAWASDLLRLPREDSEKIPGTLWIVPHKIDAKSVSEIEILLRERHWTPLRTASDEKIRPAGRIAPLVDEMGFLAELYSVMDWCWVGGGFGSSVHSTIEPSIYGLPIVAGPNGREKFDEIPLLIRQGQLKILDSEAGSPIETILRFAVKTSDAEKEKWSASNQAHRGASERIWRELLTRIF